MDEMYFALEILGTVAFAVSGAMVAINRKMDIFGVVILGMTTAVGGGIIRDLIIGVTPPTAFQKPIYALISIGVSIIVFLPFLRSRINTHSMIFVIIDALGLGVFAVIGYKAGAQFDNIFLQIFLGTLTGVGGGALRDIFAREMPMIFVRNFYACACIIGTIVYALLTLINENLAAIASILVVVILRMLAAKFKWSLPHA